MTAMTQADLAYDGTPDWSEDHLHDPPGRISPQQGRDLAALVNARATEIEQGTRSMTNTEVVAPRNSAEAQSVSQRVCAAKAEIGAIPKNGFNPHGKYKFASTDDVYHALRPILAKHGLDLILSISSAEVREGANGKPWCFVAANIGFDGEAPQMRHMALPVTGPQTFEAVNSYLQKQYLRARLQIETGEYDEEDMTKDNPPAPPRRTPPAPVEAAPPTDPETGELLPPSLLPVPGGDKPDFMLWGAALAGALKAAATAAEIDAWIEANTAPLNSAAMHAPKIHERLEAVASARREELDRAALDQNPLGAG